MTRRTSRELLIAAAALFAAFAVLTVWVDQVGRIPGDAWARAHLIIDDATQEQWQFDIEQFFSTLGSPVIGGFTTLIAVIITWRTVDERSAALIAAAAVAVLFEPVITGALDQTEAATELGTLPDGYPSGHAIYAAAVYGTLIVVGRVEVRVLAAIGIVGMFITRLTSGGHLFNDMVGGTLLGAAWLCLVVALFQRR